MATTLSPYRPSGRWIEHWDPEDEEFWAHTGRRVARRNLLWSIVAEHLGFSVWLLWSVSAALLTGAGFGFSAQQLFWLVAVPNLVGSFLRLPYTFAVPRFGGRNWTVVSALLLLLPTLLFAFFVQRPGTPYWVFVLVAGTAGVGGGNFASSMANVNFFYPQSRKGAALGLNAAGGNLGAAFVQFSLPVVVGAAGAFGLARAAGVLHLERAGLLYAALALLAAGCAFAFMDNLHVAMSRPRDQLAVLRHGHTWVVAFLYVGSFGSFIGCSAAMPLLIRINFWDQPLPEVPGIGIDFAHYAFLGALVGSLTRPLGGWLADRFGGAPVTAASFVTMTGGTVLVLATLSRLVPVPAVDAPAAEARSFHYSAAARAAVAHNTGVFGWFLLAFLVVFAATGVANGSTYRMIPAIWRARARLAGPEGSPARAEAELRAPNESSAVLGLVSAVGAFGGFLVPVTFGAPWVGDPAAAVRAAFEVFAGFYVVCLAVTWVAYLRRGSALAREGV